MNGKIIFLLFGILLWMPYLTAMQRLHRKPKFQLSKTLFNLLMEKRNQLHQKPCLLYTNPKKIMHLKIIENWLNKILQSIKDQQECYQELCQIADNAWAEQNLDVVTEVGQEIKILKNSLRNTLIHLPHNIDPLTENPDLLLTYL